MISAANARPMVEEKDGIQLIAGLGNPGQRYRSTRHNAGFWFADTLAKRFRGQFRAEARFQAAICRIDLNGSMLWLLEPDTFMNRSGQSLQLFSEFYKIPPRRMLVVHDEIDLRPGTARLKFGGGHGGHNGLRDITHHLGRDFWRLRLGVGHPGHRDQVVDYVLTNPSAVDHNAIADSIDDSISLLELLIRGEMEKAMHQLHSRNPPDLPLKKGGKKNLPPTKEGKKDVHPFEKGVRKDIPPFGKGGRGRI